MDEWDQVCISLNTSTKIRTSEYDMWKSKQTIYFITQDKTI